jgi:hypothetical protein
MTRALEIVHVYAQKARTDGYFTAANIASMKSELSQVLQVGADEIIVIADQTPKYRFDSFDQREMIHYEVRIPIKKIMAMAGSFGITDAQNSTMYPIKGAVPSEVLAP